MKAVVRLLLVLCALAMLGGCASGLMTKAGAMPAPESGKAMVVFMRPSMFGGAIQSSVYDTHGTHNTFIGIVSAKTKVAYQADPGNHLFMVIAENADFMNATLEAGKTYYVLVKPRVGVWKARFSLIPIHNDAKAEYSLQSKDFTEWQAATQYVVNTPASEQWYAEHKADIEAKQQDYTKKWDAMDPADKAVLTLHAEDGT